MDVLDVNDTYKTGDKLAAADFNKVIRYIKGLAQAIEECMVALNLEGKNIDFISQSDYNALVANDNLDPNKVYIIQ